MNTVLSLAEYIRYFICEPKVRETFGDMFQYYSIILCAVSCTPSRITGTGDTERIQMREEMNTCRKKMRKRNQVKYLSRWDPFWWAALQQNFLFQTNLPAEWLLLKVFPEVCTV